MKKKHPFDPIIFKNSKSILIGTLPPETAPFYFSNTPKTRLWDLLYTLDNKQDVVSKNKYLLTNEEKLEVLRNLSLSLTDIILEYDRLDMDSVEDSKIIPYSYQEILSLIKETEITQLLFLYKNAALWFLHSLKGEKPRSIDQINYKIDFGEFHKLTLNKREITCTILPMPLNRGRKGETMAYKLEVYKGLIQP
jgi:G:T/U-mismatch repair DNA glycosylase